MDGIAANFQEETEPKQGWWSRLIQGFKDEWADLKAEIECGLDMERLDNEANENRRQSLIQNEFFCAFVWAENLDPKSIEDKLDSNLQRIGKKGLNQFGKTTKAEIIEFAENMTEEQKTELLQLRQDIRSRNNPAVDNIATMDA